MIDIKRLDFAYNGEWLFRNLDMTLEPGNIYGLLGLNGAGKSTLLKLMTGLLFPQSGTIDALGHTPGAREPSFLSQVFMLPEELNVPGITAEQYVGSLAPFYRDFDRARFSRYMQEFKLPTDRQLTKLSYGQKKKFLLSFGLACQSSLLVLDEPTNGLDIPSKGLFRRLVAEAATDRRIFVISTHQVRDVESLIDPIVILHEGNMLFDRSMTEITAKMHMTHTTSRPEPHTSGLLYSEPAVGGFWTVWAGADEEGRIDLEVLFNTMIAHPELYAALFAGKEAEHE